MTTQQKNSTKRRPPAREPARRQPAKATAPERAAPAAALVVPAPPPPPTEVALPEVVPTSAPETIFATRMAPPEPERPLPAARRAIFFDVENTSRAQHIARVIEYLAVDQRGSRTDFVAVGNWRVIGHDTARLLAHHGAHLIHSAPSVGVKDWSDLRIAVAAGVWLATARPGDVVEVVSDDQAFDAVGDVAASLGITFHRLSYRGLAGVPAGEPPVREPAREPASQSRGRHRRGGRGRSRGSGDVARPVPAAVPAPVAERRAPAPSAAAPHTAPHDEIVAVVRDLMEGAPAGTVTIDTLANALKARGFSRPPGSPRLITRLRRIKEIEVSRSGTITLVDSGTAWGEPAVAPASDDTGPLSADSAGGEPTDETEPDGNRAPASGDRGPAPAGRRRRSRRGGRRHRRGAPKAATAT